MFSARSRILMPKFIYTIILSSLILWILLLRKVTFTQPNTTTSVIEFLLLLFLALTSTLSLAFYVIYYKKAPKFTNLKHIYRKSLKWAGFIGLYVAAIASLKAFKVLNIVDFLILTILFYITYAKLKKKRL